MVVGLVVLALAGLATLAIVQFRDRDSPAAGDFVAIEDVPRQESARPVAGPDASTGSFSSPCGRNEIGHRNHDNLVTAPGRSGGAHHMHEYVGNLSADAFSTESTLASARTTCGNGDKSVYFWPVLRSGDAAAHGGHDGLVPPVSVRVRFHGNPTSEVVAMPRFLRVGAGDARAATSANPVALAHWSCTGHPDRATPLYPLCPPGERVARTFDFPSCWDGRRTDSSNHRDHVVFPAADGTCPHNTFQIPKLRLTVTYALPPGQRYLIDTLPGQRHSPLTDHADFINVMPERLMARAVDCINAGRDC
jgi:hypothetical protein